MAGLEGGVFRRTGLVFGTMTPILEEKVVDRILLGIIGAVVVFMVYGMLVPVGPICEPEYFVYKAGNCLTGPWLCLGLWGRVFTRPWRLYWMGTGTRLVLV